MGERASSLLEWLLGLPDWLVYFLIGAAAALENLIPPIPADVIVVVGAVIAGAGGADPGWLFIVVWISNVASALLVYLLGLRYGAGFFQTRLGTFLLAPPQVAALSRAYRRFGFPIIFLSRFLPVFRPIVPVFAGVARVPFLATALPVGFASALWYGLLVYAGSAAGANWQRVLEMLADLGGWLWIAAGALLALLGWWWLRTRRALEALGEEELEGRG
jgi:membrane protein DedA with SNARE-associated domain